MTHFVPSVYCSGLWKVLEKYTKWSHSDRSPRICRIIIPTWYLKHQFQQDGPGCPWNRTEVKSPAVLSTNVLRHGRGPWRLKGANLPQGDSRRKLHIRRRGILSGFYRQKIRQIFACFRQNMASVRLTGLR